MRKELGVCCFAESAGTDWGADITIHSGLLLLLKYRRRKEKRKKRRRERVGVLMRGSLLNRGWMLSRVCR